MNINTQLPAWAWGLMGLGLALLAALVALSVRRNRGVKRTLFAAPYSLWMILFTVLPVILIGYYAFTDQNGAFTLDNFRNFWDSNYTKNQLYASLGPEAAQYMVRGTVNVDTLVYSLWMAFLCTMICLALGYPAALFMADRKMKLGPSLAVSYPHLDVYKRQLSFSNFNPLSSAKMMSINITTEEWQQAPAGDYIGTMSFTIRAQ